MLSILVVIGTGASSSAATGLLPFSYRENFNANDPFQFWISNGSYSVNYKGLDAKSNVKRKSFQIDLSFGTATYVYFALPVHVPCSGKLNFEARVSVERAENASIALGADILYQPSPISGILIFERFNGVTKGWQTSRANVIGLELQHARSITDTYIGGASANDFGMVIDKISLLLFSEKGGGRIVLNVDEMSLRGIVPNSEEYNRQSKEKWGKYIKRIQADVRGKVEEIGGYKRVLNRSDDVVFLEKTLVRAQALKRAAFERGYPTGTEYSELTSQLESLKMLRANMAAAQNPFPLALSLYPLDPVSKIKILPLTYPLPVPADNSVMLTACPGEYEPASFVIHAHQDLKDVTVEVTDLKGPKGETLAHDAVDVRLVKCWYQSGEGTINNEHKKVLVPELLLKDDRLARVDYEKQANSLRVNKDGREFFVDITSPTSAFPHGVSFDDSQNLLPFDLPFGQNKQIWLTIHVPDNAAPGIYKGSVLVKVHGDVLASCNLSVNVLPFELKEPVLEYSIYYEGMLSDEPHDSKSLLKSEKQYFLEHVDMKAHGISNPTINQGNESLRRALKIRERAGLTKGNLYQMNGTSYAQAKREFVALSRSLGYGDAYMYARDEANGNALRKERPSFIAAHKAGVKVFVAVSDDAVEIVGDLLDLPILGGGSFKPEVVEKWHALGKKVFIYSNPQAGIEDPMPYRRNYGFALWCNGYDGVMDFAYQFAFGEPWNDFDHAQYRDHMFTYPTTNGVIDTIQWEGFREAVDDVRYLSALLSMKNTEQHKTRAFVCSLVSKGIEPRDIRQEIIRLIMKQ